MVICRYLMRSDEFSNWLREELDRRGWTQAKLAGLMGMSPAQVTRIMSGERGIGEQSLTAIAKAFRIPPEEVYRAAGLLPARAGHDELVDRAEHMLRSFKTEQYRQIALATLEALLVQEEKGGYNANGAATPAASQPKP